MNEERERLKVLCQPNMNCILRPSSFILLPSFILFLFLSFTLHPSSLLNADDTGIDKARLIEQSLGQYVVEIDTIPRLGGAYRQPVFPPRFEMVGAVERDRMPGYLAIRYRFETDGEPLGAGDTLLLPWDRSGVALTVQWADGRLQQGLFVRDVTGIEIDIGTFRSKPQSKESVTVVQFEVGLKHVLFGWCHIVLVLSASLLCKDLQIFKLLMMFAAGGAVSLILVDVGLPPLPTTMVEVCILVAALLSARSAAIGQKEIAPFYSVMFLTGVLDALGHYQILTQTGMEQEILLPALFGFVLGTNVAQLVVALVAILMIHWIAKMDWKSATLKTSSLLVGGGAAAAMAVVLTGMATPFPSAVSRSDKNETLSLPGLGQAMTQRPNPRQLRSQQATHPLTGYLTIEPFEVRLELLVRLQNATALANLEIPDQIPVDRQVDVASMVQRYVAERFTLNINGQPASPVFQQSNFVLVTAGGILIRQQPIPEAAESAVLGLVFAFETGELADNIELQWTLFPSDVTSIPFSILDPFSSLQQTLLPSDPVLFWENKLTGFQPRRARPVPVSKISFPLVSAIIASFCALLWILRRKWPGKAAVNWLVGLGLMSATFLYPYVRWSMEIPAANAWLVNRDEATLILDDLLTNAYRAFELRNEDKAYDQLAQSVMGDQLQEFYLQSRKSMEIQERGGARARIDKVEIQNIQTVQGLGGGELEIKCGWIASGSVNHFGHTHYRNNVYEAIIVISSVDGFWKIKQIQITDESRFL